MREEMINPRLFIRHWFQAKGQTMKPSGHFDGNNPSILSTIILDYHELYKVEASKARKAAAAEDAPPAKLTKPITDKQLEYAWSDFLIVERKRVTQAILAGLTYNGGDDAELRRWLTGVIGATDDFEFKLTAIKHTIWCAKRKMFNLQVVHHLTPIFWGAQNGGKSTAIKKLVEPLKDLTLQWGMDQVVDPRNTRALSENYICILDEMAGMGRVNMEEIKRILTSELVDYRPMRTNDSIKVQQNCTFIGTSNKSTQELIWDSTGVRRYVDYKCLDNMDRELVNNANATTIWRSIDENIERGFYESIAGEMRKHQEALTAFDEFSEFVEGQELAPVQGKPAFEIKCHDLYSAYVGWRIERNYTTSQCMSARTFYARLASYNIQKKRVRFEDSKGQIICYYVNAAALLFTKKPIASAKVLEFAK